MKRLALVLTLLCLFASGDQASAELCTIDAVPAATLLLPYFEVDLFTPPLKGVDTLFSINNASAAPTIAHVTVWSDWSQPVLDFDIYLTGYDVQTVSMRQVLIQGNLPVTADAQSDMGPDPDPRDGAPHSTCVAGVEDSCSPHGANPEWDASFDGTGVLVDGVEDCLEIFPFFVNPLLTGTRLDTLHAKLTGLPIDGACFGADYGAPNTRARGYITIDNVRACSLIFPNDPGYFSDGVEPGLASNVNQLWGDWFLVDPVFKYAAGDTLVHVEADDDFTGGANDYTFYRRYTGPINPSEDNREPLGTSWGVRYLNGPPFTGTSLVVWRDSTITDIRGDGFTCGFPGSFLTGPSWHPMNETQALAFSESEDWEELCGPVFGPPGPPVSPPDPTTSSDLTCFPLETQRVPLEGDLEPFYDFGWLYLNLNVGIDDPRAGEPGVDYDPSGIETMAQSYVQSIHSAVALYSVGYPAAKLISACQDFDVTLFADP